jgi:Ni,Fe-hydrogenase I small subunit
MAITRRQFVTRLGTLAAAMGMSQLDLAKVTEAFAHGSAWAGQPWTTKPKVVWVHGAECTGCSVSLLSLFESATGKAIEGMTTIAGQPNQTLTALDFAVAGDGTGTHVTGSNPYADGTHPYGHRTINKTKAVTGSDFNSVANANTGLIVDIADVLIDFIDLQYHETVMGMGSDLAYQWLKDNMDNGNAGAPFVLVVEGAIQPKELGGYWDSSIGAPAGTTPWCSIGVDGTPNAVAPHELSFDDVVFSLATRTTCAAIIPIGQCACFGGYPGCVSPVLGESQTGAMGTEAFLRYKSSAAVNKVIAVPGCPTNPWWFILTVVAWLVDFTNAAASSDGPLGILHRGTGGAMDVTINAAAVDDQRRLKAVYGQTLHGPFCARYQDFLNGTFAAKSGDPGCLQLIGCKGPQTMTLCGAHGWNGQQPTNDRTWDYGISALNGTKGGNCVAGGAPCMGCTEAGYPDSFLPFIVR